MRKALIHAASEIFVERPYLAVGVPGVAERAEVRPDDALIMFADTHAVGTAVLDHERASMHAVRTAAEQHPGPVLKRIPLALRMVGDNLAEDIVIRAGVTLASEAHRHFPERPLNPFRTWMAFLSPQLSTARELGELREGVDLEAAAWLITTAAMGTMDFFRTKGLWLEAPNLLWQTAHDLVSLIARQPSSDRESDV